ncbi:GSCFA domain-containing protein [Mesorhizobium sp. M0142]|uniref:GSCFA domain-containing protein n=1 Tax=unclassified Mesorhizobium TaxID=325217 RepID=UPI000A04F181|nr:GSCFA domain-containing protein [Mesorhizobium sp. LSHC420B00]
MSGIAVGASCDHYGATVPFLERVKRRYLRIRNRLGYAKPVRLMASDKLNAKYGDFVSSGAITIRKTPVLTSDDIFFTMGSCFAQEIRRALTNRRIACVPSYGNISFDPAEAIVDELPRQEHMNFYNTFTVRLQLEQMLGVWDQADDDWWQVKKRVPWGSASFQDPYRRGIFAKSPEVLKEVIGSVNREMRAGFDAATAFIFTFGMTEVFINKASGKAAAQKPLYLGGGGMQETTLHVSSFQENYANVMAAVDMVRERKPDAPIILTVSPVALARTFQDADVVTASTEGKSVLRAVLGQVCRERDNVHYLPSFELVTYGGLARSYREDLRHVKNSVVDEIVEQFFNAYFAPSQVPSSEN